MIGKDKDTSTALDFINIVAVQVYGLDETCDCGGMTPKQFYSAKMSFLCHGGERLPRKIGKAVIFSKLEYIPLPLLLGMAIYGLHDIALAMRAGNKLLLVFFVCI